MSKARQRERKKRRNKTTFFVEVPRDFKLKKFRVTIDDVPVQVQGISGNRIILAEAPPLGSMVKVEHVYD